MIPRKEDHRRNTNEKGQLTAERNIKKKKKKKKKKKTNIYDTRIITDEIIHTHSNIQYKKYEIRKHTTSQ